MVSVAAVLRLKSPPAAFAPAAAVTVIVNAALDAPESFAVTVDSPPASATDPGASTSVAVGRASSSASVSVAFAGAAIPLPPVAVPEMVTRLSGESTALSAAVIVTVPVLAVAFAAMVSVVSPLRLKSPSTAPDAATAAAATVTVTASLDVPLSAALTVATPPFSETDDDDSTSETVGAPSSSRSVRVASGGSAAPGVPDAEPFTVTRLSGESVSLPTAVTVTTPALVVRPAATVSAAGVLRLKSPSAAPVDAVADTAIVTALAEGWLRVAVTVATPADSEIDAGTRASVEFGRESSSAMVSVRSAGAATSPCPPATAPLTVAVLSAESMASSVATIVTAPALAVCPAAMVSVLAALRLKPPSAASAA